jgi:ornithine cyclodeaminase
MDTLHPESTITALGDLELTGRMTPAQAEKVLDEAFADLAAGRAEILGRQRIDCQQVKLSTMGALWPGAGFAAVKSYLTVNGQFSFTTTGWDTETNQALFTMAGDELTRIRTPALACLAARRLMAPGARKLTVFGAGLQGRAHVHALLSAFSFEQVDLVDLVDVGEFCGEVAEIYGCAVRQVEATAAVTDADLVVTTTRSKQPLFNGCFLKPGATVIAMGSSLPTGRELDDTTLARSDRVVVEWLPQSLVEAGEVVLGLQSGALTLGRIVDLPTLYRAESPWRSSDDEILTFKSVGVGLADAAVARALWQRWKESA